MFCTKLLLFPVETCFSMDLLSLSKWYLMLPDSWNTSLTDLLFCPPQQAYIQLFHKMVDLPSEYIFYCFCYCTNSLTGILLSLLPPINRVVRVNLLEHKLSLHFLAKNPVSFTLHLAILIIILNLDSHGPVSGFVF